MAKIMVAMMMDFFGVLNLFKSFNKRYLNNISSKIGPIIDEEMILIYNGTVTSFVLFGAIKNINIFSKQEIDMPRNTSG